MTSRRVGFVLVVYFAALVFLIEPSHAGLIDFNVTYLDTTVGFVDPVYGATRRSTFESVFTYLNTVLDHTGKADIRVNASRTDGGGALASGGTWFFTGPNGFQSGLAFSHITTGTDPAVGTPDIQITFDFGYSWNSGTGAPGSGEIDLFSVALHEVTHGLGFSSLVSSSGTSRISDSDPGVFSVYDSFLERGDGTKLFGTGGDYLRTTSDLTSNDVYFDGPNASAANGGERVKVYSPSTFASGSSISHIVDDPSAVMQYSIGFGDQRRQFTAPELGILQDLGYSISAVPEPSTVLLSFAGCGLWGLIRWRRRIGPSGDKSDLVPPSPT